jgi:hypothetical protein
MTTDALKLRKESGTAAGYGGGARRQCPVVQVTQEGELRSVVAC